MANPLALTYDDINRKQPARPGLAQAAIRPSAALPGAAPVNPAPAKQTTDSGPGVLDYINRGDPVKDIARGIGDRMKGIGNALAATAQQARQPNTWDDSGTQLQYSPTQPLASSAAPAVQKPPTVAAPVSTDQASYSNEPNAPANPLASQATPRQMPQRLASPGANTEIGSVSTSSPNVTQTSGVEDSMRQIANIRALREPEAERLQTNGTNWEADERQRRADFDNFSNRASLSSAVRDAAMSGNAQRMQAAGNALSQFDAVSNQPVNAAAERANRVALQDMQGDRAREVANIQGQNALAQAALQGRNQLAVAGVQGENQRALADAQGQTQRDVARISKEMNPLEQQAKELSLEDARTRAGLRQRLMSASPEEQQAIARQIAALDGKYQDRDGSELAKARAGLVGDLAKAYNGPMGAPIGPDKQPVSFDKFAAPALAAAFGGGQQQPAAPAFSDYAAQVRARNPGQNLTDQQIQAAYAQRYGK